MPELITFFLVRMNKKQVYGTLKRMPEPLRNKVKRKGLLNVLPPWARKLFFPASQDHSRQKSTLWFNGLRHPDTAPQVPRNLLKRSHTNPDLSSRRSSSATDSPSEQAELCEEKEEILPVDMMWNSVDVMSHSLHLPADGPSIHTLLHPASSYGNLSGGRSDRYQEVKNEEEKVTHSRGSSVGLDENWGNEDDTKSLLFQKTSEMMNRWVATFVGDTFNKHVMENIPFFGSRGYRPHFSPLLLDYGFMGPCFMMARQRAFITVRNEIVEMNLSLR